VAQKYNCSIVLEVHKLRCSSRILYLYLIHSKINRKKVFISETTLSFISYSHLGRQAEVGVTSVQARLQVALC
jgi:hypothetical protein